MFTKNLTDQFSADLLKTVQGILEAKKCPKDCECEKCEKEDEKGEKEDEKEETKEEYVSNAQRKAVWAARADGGKGHPDKKKKMKKEEVELEEGKMKELVTKHMDAGHDYQAALKKAKKELGKVQEEAEQIDELSKATMGRYINKAATRMSTQGVTAGLKIAADEKSKKNFDNIKKREKGIATAVNKLTKEDQDFIDSLNDELFDEIAIAEARGRPRKAGAKDFTIHPKTKEKLMHNNPEHMKKIEALQRTGVLQKPKVEAGQHIINQLRKASTSMTGGATIHFTHGDSKHVSGTHAAKLVTKYNGLKPNEKEDFQKKIGHSHEQLMKHV